MDFVRYFLIPSILGLFGVAYGLGAMFARRINVRYHSQKGRRDIEPVYIRGWLKYGHACCALLAGIALWAIAFSFLFPEFRSDRHMPVAVTGAVLTVLTAVAGLRFGESE